MRWVDAWYSTTRGQSVQIPSFRPFYVPQLQTSSSSVCVLRGACRVSPFPLAKQVETFARAISPANENDSEQMTRSLSSVPIRNEHMPAQHCRNGLDKSLWTRRTLVTETHLLEKLMLLRRPRSANHFSPRNNVRATSSEEYDLFSQQNEFNVHPVSFLSTMSIRLPHEPLLSSTDESVEVCYFCPI